MPTIVKRPQKERSPPMLVLSRRQNEKIVFPNLGISVQVIRVAGKVVRIGVEAPPNIRVLREELEEADQSTPEVPAPISRRLRHTLRNHLNTAALSLQVLHRKIEAGQTEDTEALIFKVFNVLHDVGTQLDAEKKAESVQLGTRNRRALIVEDNASESQLLAEYLRMSGYDVDVVDDGLEAIAYLKEKERPDVVLLDMCMPRLDGPKTVSSIRCEREWNGLKLFAVSGANQREVGVKCGPGGVDRWFSKPVDVRNLVGAMNRELDNSVVPA
jgi:carbon storage regulator CsrA